MGAWPKYPAQLLSGWDENWKVWCKVSARHQFVVDQKRDNPQLVYFLEPWNVLFHSQRLATTLQQYFSVESPVQPAYGTHYAALHRSSNIKWTLSTVSLWNLLSLFLWFLVHEFFLISLLSIQRVICSCWRRPLCPSHLLNLVVHVRSWMLQLWFCHRHEPGHKYFGQVEP